MKYRALTILAILIAPSISLAQGVISTVAGNGTNASTGDAGPATSAALHPNGVTVDAAGNIYIADRATSVIRKVNKAGIISTVAGFAGEKNQFSGDGGAATKASIYIASNHNGMAVDAAGNLYIADDGHHRIRKVDLAGTITTVAGNGHINFSGDGGPATAATVWRPSDVALDRAGNLYIADTNNSRIRKVDKAGIITTVAGNGSIGNNGDGGPATSAALFYPMGVAVDGAGNIYIADQNAYNVRKVDTAGIIHTVAGNAAFGFSGDGGPATDAMFAAPYSVAADGSGNIYIADYGNIRVRKVDSSGIVTTIAGGPHPSLGDGGPSTDALVQPAGVAVDSAGNLYVADEGHNRIRKIALPRPAPLVNALGVVNNASFAVGSNPIAPGAIAAVFGANMNDGSLVLFSSFGPDGKLVTKLAGAEVAINGEPVPIFYSTPAQLGIQIPTDLAGATASIQVTANGQTSAPQTISIDPLSPGIFSTNQSGHGQGAILIANTNTLVAPTGSIPGRTTRPAKPGEFITIFCTGLGQVSPLLATGLPATTNTTVATPTVTIDGAPAAVQFSGMAPGFVGLYQVNVQVPPGTRSASDIPVVLTIGGKPSNTVTIAVSGS